MKTKEARFWNKITNQYVEGVHWVENITPEIKAKFPGLDWIQHPENWVQEPDMSAVEGVLQKYWKDGGGKPVEMSSTEKKVVDDAIQVQVDNNLKEQLIVEKGQEILREQAITKLIEEGKLNEDKSLKK